MCCTSSLPGTILLEPDCSMTTFSRRELIRRGTALGTLLAVPAAADATAQTASTAAAQGRSRTSIGGRRLSIDRRQAAHQRPRHLHDHQRFDDAAGGARGDGRGGTPLRASRRARRGRRRPPRDAHRCRVGPRHEWLLRRSRPWRPRHAWRAAIPICTSACRTSRVSRRTRRSSPRTRATSTTRRFAPSDCGWSKSRRRKSSRLRSDLAPRSSTSWRARASMRAP